MVNPSIDHSNGGSGLNRPVLAIWTVALFEVPMHLHVLTHQIGLLQLYACLGAVVLVIVQPRRRFATAARPVSAEGA